MIKAFIQRVKFRFAEIQQNEELVPILFRSNGEMRDALSRQRGMIGELSKSLDSERAFARTLRSRAHRNACVGLLAIGLFAVQAYGFVLYYLGK